MKTGNKNDIRNLLADIIAWELDLSQYANLESIIDATYIVKKKEGVNSPTKEEVDKILKSVQPNFASQQSVNRRDELIKEIACTFFRHWWNSPGNNTEQGFDSWWKEYKNDYLSKK
jgi:hypothetical protein